MATKIRLKRIGRRNRPFYRVIITDSRNRRDGAAIEEIGWFNPLEKINNYVIDQDRILHWLKLGAQPSKAIRNLMKHSGLSFHWHLIRQGLDEKSIEKEMKKWLLNREDILKQRELSKKEKKETEAAIETEDKKDIGTLTGPEVKDAETEEKTAQPEIVESSEKPEEQVEPEDETGESDEEKKEAEVKAESVAEKVEEPEAAEAEVKDESAAEKVEEPETKEALEQKELETVDQKQTETKIKPESDQKTKAQKKSVKAEPKKKDDSKSSQEKKEIPEKSLNSKTEKVDKKAETGQQAKPEDDPEKA